MVLGTALYAPRSCKRKPNDFCLFIMIYEIAGPVFKSLDVKRGIEGQLSGVFTFYKIPFTMFAGLADCGTRLHPNLMHCDSSIIYTHNLFIIVCARAL